MSSAILPQGAGYGVGEHITLVPLCPRRSSSQLLLGRFLSRRYV